MRIYLSENDILKTAASTVEYKKGYKLYLEEAVDGEVLAKNGVIYVYSASVEDDGRKYKVFIIFNERGMMDDYQCSCEGSKIWRGSCEHVCAVLFNIKLKSGEDERKRLRNERLNKFINAFEGISIEKPIVGDGYVDKVHIKTAISRCNDLEEFSENPSICFSVGINKMYVIKDITGFMEAIENRSVVSYGKNLSFKHDIEIFDDESQKVIEFLSNETSRTADAISMDNYGRYFTFKRILSLTRSGLDDFFELFKGKEVDADFTVDGINVLFLSEDEPDVFYNITKNGKSIIIKGGEYLIPVMGNKYAYLLSEYTMYRISKEKHRVIEIMENELQYSGKIVIPDSMEEKFVNFVLPVLGEKGLSNVSEVQSEFNIQPLVAKIYLDNEDGRIIAKILFCYNDIEINALEEVETDFYRNELEESILLGLFNSYGFEKDMDRKISTLEGSGRVYMFYRNGLNQLNSMENVEVYATDSFKMKSQKLSYTKATFGIRASSGLLEIAPINTNLSMSEILDIVSAYNLKKKYYKLKDGSFLDIDNEEAKETADFINSLNLSKKDIAKDKAVLPSYRSLYVDSLIEDEDKTFEKDEAFNKIVSDFSNKELHIAELPPELEPILRTYQKEGFSWLSTIASYNFGGILADDMGLGKTLQIITLIKSRLKENCKPSLIVVPTSLIYNWESEFKKFAKDVDVKVVAGLPEKRRQILAEPADVYVTTYDMLKRDIDVYKEMEFDVVAADEAQHIKNPLTQNAKAIKELKSETRFALTGTPIENSLSELWSIFDFVMPGYLYSYNKFSKELESPIMKEKDDEKAARLKQLIAPFILRRIKKEVLSEIPDKVISTLYAKMTDEQINIYSAYLARAKGEVTGYANENKMLESQIQILALITRLRQICCHPKMFIDDYTGGSGKLEIVMETIKNSMESGHRMLLFSQFTSMLGILREELNKEGISYFYLDGSTPAQKRADMADRFNSGENSVFLIALKAGGTGLNLTGADVVIHFDPWWNPAVMDQASDRAHRIGQKNVVQVFNVVAKDTIEEKIVALQEKKRDLIDLVITENASFINKMSKEELMELFGE